MVDQKPKKHKPRKEEPKELAKNLMKKIFELSLTKGQDIGKRDGLQESFWMAEN